MGTLTPEYRWLLPAVLTAADPDTRPVRRSTRDWVVDVLCFTIGLGFAVVMTHDMLTGADWAVANGWAAAPAGLIGADFAAGVVVTAALWWRRRWPVGLAVALLPLAVFSVSASAAALILVFGVAVHRRFTVAAAVALLALAVNALFPVLRPEEQVAYLESLGWSTAFILIVLLWGMVVRSRRQLLVSLRDRAERAESEQQLRVAQARALERTRIAREMHDVLAHRISLLSLHAGALEIRPDAPSAEVAGAAGVIRASAHQALQDLREVIGVLRADHGGDGAPEPPQPTLAQVPALVEESRAAGTRVRLELDVEPGDVPDATGRAAYRIVQEGLTNARKHAPGAVVTVSVTGAPRPGLQLEIRNAAAVGTAGPAIPGTGTGLIGLAERATLAGGRLSHGRLAGGEFVLSAWLPWPRR